MIEHQIKAVTCRVACDTESGTGWLISRDRAITARHCVLAAIENGKTVELFFPNSGDIPIVGKVVAHSEDWDMCLLSLDSSSLPEPLPLRAELPRLGENWETFGYPVGKLLVGHRLAGTVAQLLDSPKMKIDIDLSIDPTVAVQNFHGFSGAVLACGHAAVGVIRTKLDGTVAALSLRQLENFLAQNGVTLPAKAASGSEQLLADRDEFFNTFAEIIQSHAGSYLFLEGAHGYGKSTFCRIFRADDKKIINLGAYCLTDPNSVLGANYRAQSKVFIDWLGTPISILVTGHSPRKEEKGYAEQILETAKYLEAFSSYCEQHGKQGLLYIDGLNEIPTEAMLVQLLGLLPAKLPPKITCGADRTKFLQYCRCIDQ